jgi:hypothetical protein
VLRQSGEDLTSQYNFSDNCNGPDGSRCARPILQTWCGRGDSNPHGVTPNGFSYQLRLSPPLRSAAREGGFVVWTIPSPCPAERADFRHPALFFSWSMIFSENRFPLFGIMLHRGLGAARLVSTPSRCRAWLGIAVERFPRVWAVLRPRFPAAHSKAFKSVASAIPPRPRGAHSYTQGAGSRQGDRGNSTACEKKY